MRCPECMHRLQHHYDGGCARCECRLSHTEAEYRLTLRSPDGEPETIANYDTATHTEPSEVRYVSSSDSVASGDEVSG